MKNYRFWVNTVMTTNHIVWDDYCVFDKTSESEFEGRRYVLDFFLKQGFQVKKIELVPELNIN